MFFKTSPSNRQYKERKQKKQDERVFARGGESTTWRVCAGSITGMVPNQSESACSLVLKSIRKGESAREARAAYPILDKQELTAILGAK